MGELRHQSTSLLTRALGRLQREYQDPMIGLAADAGFSCIGIPLPSLALEYLLLSTIWPVNGRLSMLVGDPMAGKSMLLSEIMRWNYHRCSGRNYLVETEYSKHSYDLCLSILGWDYAEGLGYIPAANMNDWQERTQSVFREERVMMDGIDAISMVPGAAAAQQALSTRQKTGKGSKFINKKRTVVKKTDMAKDDFDPVGRTCPVIVGIDAVMSVALAETCARIEAEGFANRAHPAEAMSITQFLRKLPVDMYGYPFQVIGVNHKKIKPATDGFSQPERSKPGGKHLDFLESLELECTKTNVFRTQAYEGQNMRIKCYKNCLGTTGRQINVNVKWWTAPIDFYGNVAMRQQTVFDWYEASIRMLFELGATDKRVFDVVDLVQHTTAGKGPRISSRKLGISDKAPVSLDKAGSILQSTPEVLDPLRDLMGIKRYPGFQPNIDFRTQVEEAKENMRLLEVRREYFDAEGKLT
jgi:hypothetical protein